MRQATRKGMLVKLCIEQPCASAARARGMCNKHYLRKYLKGEIEVLPQGQPIEYYFFRWVDASAPCWEWTGNLDRDGYGRFKVGPAAGRPASEVGTFAAHRWSYEFLTGEKLGDLVLDHACRNRPCVNPDHLTPMTKWDHDSKTMREVHGIIRRPEPN